MEKELIEYIRREVDMNEVRYALGIMDRDRCPLSLVRGGLHDRIVDLLEEYGQDHDLPEGWWWEEFEPEDVLFELL